MRIGIIDAEIMGKSKHRFPNLVCMKLSNYYKQQGDEVFLVLDYNDIDNFDKVFISKVFIKTEIPFEQEDKSLKNEENIIEYYEDNELLNNPKVEFGGTGFYYDKAPKLDNEIEHMIPDYHLYDGWVDECIEKGAKEKEFTYYRDYSIGFVTRGCFRQCQFCVNKHYKKCEKHSPLDEFMDTARPKLCFLDDNFFACPNWKEIIKVVKSTNKRFQFKQGLDERLLTKDKIDEMVTWKYDGNFIFAFDNIEDKEIIESKLTMIYTMYPNWKANLKFYVFCGFDRNGIYNDEFWKNDIKQMFERYFILAKYGAVPYTMRHENYNNAPSEYKGIYVYASAWTNQVTFFKKMSFRYFSMLSGIPRNQISMYKDNIEQYILDGKSKLSAWRCLDEFVKGNKDISDRYFDIVADDIKEYKI